MKFLGKVDNGPMNKWLSFGGDRVAIWITDPDPWDSDDTGIFLSQLIQFYSNNDGKSSPFNYTVRRVAPQNGDRIAIAELW